MLHLVALLGLAIPAAAPPADTAPALRDVRTAAQLVAAAARVGRLGGTLRLAPGEYRIDRPLRFRGRNHVNILGSGWNTTIRMAGRGDALVFEDCGFCAVRDLMVVGGEDAGSGIVFRGTHSSSNTVDTCRIAEFGESGIRFEGDPKSPLSSNTVSRCHLIGNRGDQLYSRCNNDFFILQNQFGTHGTFPRTGCLLDRSAAGTYSLNYHWGNVVAFRMGAGCHFNRIENNRFENARREAVILGGPNPYACMLTIFTGNTVHTSSEEASGRYPAIVATNVTDMTFTSNQVFSWDAAHARHRSSLVIGSGCRNWIVKDCVFRHNTGRSLVYEEDAGHIVKDNLAD